jgi:hypothetical protein
MSDTQVLENTSSNNQVEEPKLKKENSYTYWVNNDPNFFGGQQPVDIQPKKIDEQEAQRLREYV